MIVEAADAELVRAAQAGDLPAFEVLVRRHQGRVYRVALRVAGPRLAEDAAQEALVRLWLHLPRFRGESAFTSWLYRIALNASLDRLAAEPASVPLPEELPGGADGVEGVVEARARLQELQAAVLRLSPEQRGALVLRELEGLSYEEVADALGTTVPGVKGRIHRARLALARELGRAS